MPNTGLAGEYPTNKVLQNNLDRHSSTVSARESLSVRAKKNKKTRRKRIPIFNIGHRPEKQEV